MVRAVLAVKPAALAALAAVVAAEAVVRCQTEHLELVAREVEPELLRKSSITRRTALARSSM